VQFASEFAGKFGGALATTCRNFGRLLQHSNQGPADFIRRILARAVSGRRRRTASGASPKHWSIAATHSYMPRSLHRMRGSENHHPLDDCDGSEDR
jgi:hypothetical protein